MQNARVIVIGAGISGISCATKLIENGFKNVRILEAENRVGGRVFTVPFASNVLDLGAQWCHGEVNNSVFELVKNHNVLDKSDRLRNYPEVQFLSSTGKDLDDEKCGKLVNFALGILHTDEEEMKKVKGSLGNYVITKYKQALKTPEFSDIDEELAYQVLDYIHKFENSIDASDTWFDSSASGYTEYWECEGHPLLNWRDKGYQHVIDFITKKKPDPTKAIDIENITIFNKEVSNIKWNGNNQIVIKCSDGTSYDCEHVVVTCSLGVLKENYMTMFTPELPKLKTNAIEGLSIGTVDKIYLEFEKPFWGDDWTGMSFLWSREHSMEIRATSNAWLEDVFGFYIVDHQPNILCGWIGGPSARIMERLDDEKIFEGCLYLFNKFIGTKMPWTKPKNMIVSRWNSNPHFRGSYTFRSITTDFLKTSARDLSLPLHDSLGKPVVCFAGEATHDHYYSTVHGALETGRRESDRLANYYIGDLNFAQQQNSKVPKNEIEHFDAIILGAGIAGLGAGEVFRRANLNFMILEGQSRVGGRINTVNLGDQVNIDAGAQWLHGSNNELFKLAKKFELIRPELSEEAEGDYIREDGMKFDDFLVKKVDFKIGQIFEECEDFVNHRNDEKFQFPSSIEEFLSEKFKTFVESLENGDEERKKAMQLLDWHRRFQIIDNSCLNLSDISAKDWGNYSFNGESCQTHINIKNGMENLVKRLNESLKSNILLNKIVDLIYWKTEESCKILIKCSDNSIFSTNNLICTFSIGVLKERHQEMFIPPLPFQHAEVIDSIGYGTIDKIFLIFDQKWWNDDWKGLQLIWNEDINEQSHWSKFISGFDVVHPSSEHSLLAWIGGKGAIEMEKLSDREISDELMKILRKFLDKREIPNPTKFYSSRWNSNKFIRGAYSFTAKTTDHIDKWEEILSKPIKFKSNTLLFAGEACHPSYFSTVHGAFHSGMEQAENILKSINNSNPSFNNFSKL